MPQILASSVSPASADPFAPMAPLRFRRLRPPAPAGLVGLAAVALVILATAGSAPARGADFPAVTEAERALAAVPGHPNAPAVLLFRRGALEFMDPTRDASSSLTVEIRLKVLTQEGLDFGDVAILHSRLTRLTAFAGRTVSADGRVLPLTDGATFEETLSEREGYFQTKVAFAGVEVGAILDYRYTLTWDHLYYLEPWHFHEILPTLVSEIRYYLPGNVSFLPWRRETGGATMEIETQQQARGFEVRATMRDLAALPDEPLSFPRQDLSSRIMMIPREYQNSGNRVELLDSWRETCDTFEQAYAPIRRKAGGAKKKAKALAATGTTRERLGAIFAFVRDEIRNNDTGIVWPGVDAVDKVLEAGVGGSADKVLLLQAMLEAVKIDADLVWAADRDDGRVDLQVPNPMWFDRVLARVELDGEDIYLDPSDRRLGVGRLAPSYEGMPALVLAKRTPEEIVLPDSAPDAHARTVSAKLAVDDDGRVAGRVRLEAIGDYAYDHLRWGDDEAATIETWTEWLQDAYTGYDVAEVTVAESLDEQRVTVGWNVRQREEEVLGDEATLVPSRPIGPASQPFDLTPVQRATPVQFSFPGSVNAVELELSWPAGWRLEATPAAADERSAVGAYSASVEVGEDGRTLRYRRRLERRGREHMGGAEYVALRGLYGIAERHDGQAVVLARD